MTYLHFLFKALISLLCDLFVRSSLLIADKKVETLNTVYTTFVFLSNCLLFQRSDELCQYKMQLIKHSIGGLNRENLPVVLFGVAFDQVK